LSCGDEGCPQFGGREDVETQGCSGADEHGPQRDPGPGACQVVRARPSNDGGRSRSSDGQSGPRRWS
jgi:hypothetical protein